jgi:hypothetical protein
VFKVPLSVSNLFSILFGNSSEPLNIFSSYFFFLYDGIFIYLNNISYSILFSGLFAGFLFARAKMS